MACHIEIHDRLWDRLFVAVTQPVPIFRRLLPESRAAYHKRTTPVHHNDRAAALLLWSVTGSVQRL